ncbi:MAG TPA: hypothetical protein VG984_03425 [Candidatus Paceibacterota bacterium]|nr:hypothetical protein [Candidatus Paceibacterota bacterium]
MDLEPQADQNSEAEKLPNKKVEIDLSKILLPKKDVPSVDSAQRVDASVLLAQEQNATLIKPSEPVSKPAQNFSIGSGEPRENSASASATVGVAPASTDAIRPLQTYQNDVASVIQQGASVVSIAAAEADRRGAQSLADMQPEAAAAPSWRTPVFVGVGILLILAAGGLLWYAVSRPAPLPTQVTGETPYISTDGIIVVTVPQNTSATSLMQQLTQAKNAVSLSLGLVAQLYIQKTPTTTDALPTYETAQDLLGTLAPSLPGTFLRNIAPVYVLGVHTFGINQPLLLLKVDSYEQAYAGMLAWETTMHKDLSPLFDYTPAPKIKPVPTGPVSTTTAATSTSSTTPVQTIPVFVPTNFTDKVVVNHDARILQNADGTIYFLWTFLDRNTLLITTNEDTVRAVITRLTQAPILTVPSSQ